MASAGITWKICIILILNMCCFLTLTVSLIILLSLVPLFCALIFPQTLGDTCFSLHTVDGVLDLATFIACICLFSSSETLNLALFKDSEDRIPNSGSFMVEGHINGLPFIHLGCSSSLNSRSRNSPSLVTPVSYQNTFYLY